MAADGRCGPVSSVRCEGGGGKAPDGIVLCELQGVVVPWIICVSAVSGGLTRLPLTL